jgi:hypothetical protein
MTRFGTASRAMFYGTLLVTLLNGCTSWHVVELRPEQLLANRRPNAVRIQRADRTRVVLDSPHLSGDSLIGMTRGESLAMPVSDITQIAVRRGNGLKTVGLILSIYGAGFAVFGLACAAGADCSWN